MSTLVGHCARCGIEEELKETRNGPLICLDDRACDTRLFARPTDPAPPPSCAPCEPAGDVDERGCTPGIAPASPAGSCGAGAADGPRSIAPAPRDSTDEGRAIE